MSIMSVIGTHLLGFLSYSWSLLVYWLSILFYIPFKNPHILWIIIPIWIAWFFAEFFQEKKKTSFGNAISNGVIPVWVSIDWTRMIISQLTSETLQFGSGIIVKFIICFFVLAYGVVIIIGGIKTKGFVHYFGRTREVTYILAVFTPLIYGVLELDGKFFLAVLVFFPVFYFVIELIDRLTPDPTELDEQEDKPSFSSPSDSPFPDSTPSDFNPSRFDPSSNNTLNLNPPGFNPPNLNSSEFNSPDFSKMQHGRF
ncbi:hypothetical protein HYT52_04055 [Candidatus Woesearchaeota archaeon]|nr:hypothetical protein [Candidatus Woesearchaeota archaeon]